MILAILISFQQRLAFFQRCSQLKNVFPVVYKKRLYKETFFFAPFVLSRYKDKKGKIIYCRRSLKRVSDYGHEFANKAGMAC